MKQANIINAPVNPTELSPEFISWLENEKADSKRRLSIVRTSFLIILLTALVVITQQPNWLNDIFGFIQTLVHP